MHRFSHLHHLHTHIHHPRMFHALPHKRYHIRPKLNYQVEPVIESIEKLHVSEPVGNGVRHHKPKKVKPLKFKF